MKTVQCFVVILLVVVCRPVVAQTDSLAKYFDDNGLSNRRNLIGFDALSLLWGTVGMHYERGLGDGIGLQVGIDRNSTFKGVQPLDFYLLNNWTTDELTPGWGISAAFHHFWAGKAPEGFYYGLRYSYRRNGIVGSESIFSSQGFGIAQGMNLFLNKHLFFCYEVVTGLYVNNLNSPPAYNYFDRLGIMLDLSLGLGVYF